LPRHASLHFPVCGLPPSVRQQLRRLGLRKSVNDSECLTLLCEELRRRHDTTETARYGELQRSLMQRLVESWPNLLEESRGTLLREAFVDISPETDGDEVPDTVFALRPYRRKCGGRLLHLSEMVDRSNETDPYLCWTTAPLSPRGFPAFPGFCKPSLDIVVAHARALGELADSGEIGCHCWGQLREKVIAPLCCFLSASEPFRHVLAAGDGAPVENASARTARVRICGALRRAKFIAVPLDSGEDGPHALAPPWRISLVLREHRPPMFALPGYLSEHVELLKLLGVRDALVLPGGEGASSSGGTEAASAMKWLYEHGAESFSDVTVRCDGGSLFLHRNILMARSEYFRAMFHGGEGGFIEGREGSADVHLFESPIDVARVLFGFLYSGEIDEAPLEGPEGTCRALELLCLSDELGVPQLFEFAQLWVANQQDLDDCADTLALAARHRAELLEQATLQLMAANIDTVEVEQQVPRLIEQHREALRMLTQRPGGQARGI